MSRIEKSIDVNVPLSTAYNQWTQFEEFPRFMEGIEEVRQLDDKRLHWRASIAGKREEWDAEIVEQVPDQRVAWRSTSGAPNSGVVTFESLGTAATRANVQLEYTPQHAVESAGAATGVLSRRAEGALRRVTGDIASRG